MSSFQHTREGYLRRKGGAWGRHAGLQNAHLSAFMETGARNSGEPG